MNPIPLEFYQRQDVVALAQELLGKWLFTQLDGEELTGGMIIETEAYAGPKDRASHAFNMRRTKRTEVMFHEGGVAYVYLCYGMHTLFNVVTNKAEIPHAILVRALLPTHGISTMEKRRIPKMIQESEFQHSRRPKFEEAKPTSKQRLCIHRSDAEGCKVRDVGAAENRFLNHFRYKKRAPLTSGPGTVCQALGIKVNHSGHFLQKKPLWIEDRGMTPSTSQIIAGPRIGIEYAQEDALLPWRFQLIA